MKNFQKVINIWSKLLKLKNIYIFILLVLFLFLYNFLLDVLIKNINFSKCFNINFYFN